MRVATYALSACILLLGATPSDAFQQRISYPLVRTTPVGCLYFDPIYPLSQQRQHLGVDLPSGRGTDVYSPVVGTIVATNATNNVAAAESYIIIRETATGVEHVLGHVRSTLPVGRRVYPRDNRSVERVATVADQGTNSHLHWGINIVSVEGAKGVSHRPGWGSGDWGWGRAPRDATASQARARGWQDVNSQVNQRSAYCSR